MKKLLVDAEIIRDRERDRWWRRGKQRPKNPPHQETTKDGKVSRFWCGCVSCESWRQEAVLPGCLVQPASLEPTKYNDWSDSDGVPRPAWPLNDWSKTGWDDKMPNKGLATVIGFIQKHDQKNGGHLDCVVIFCHWDSKFRVTSARWLAVIYDPSHG